MKALPTAAAALGDEIERFGSYFGYAAIIGLGVLALLYFAQAREVRRLREWAGRAPERDAELAQRVQSDAQRRVVAQPVPSPASPQTPAAQSAEAARKAAAAAIMEKFQQAGPTSTAAAPTGSAAPAVGPPGSLTRATPAVGAPPPAATPGADAPPAVPGAPAPTAPAPGSVAAANAARSQVPARGAPTPPAPTPPMPPGMSAATADAVAAARQAATHSRSPAFANGAGGQETHESDAARPEPLPDLPSTASRRPRAPLADVHDDGGASHGRVGAIVAAAGAILVVGVVLVVVLTSGGTDKPSAGNQIGDASPPAAVPPPPPASGLTKVERAAASVAVLNGTTQTGLASAVAQTIEKKGFTILATKTNADQQIATTTVSFAVGNERAARAVAQIMRVPSSAIGPIDANTSVAASPEAKIVVLVGTDKSGAG